MNVLWRHLRQVRFPSWVPSSSHLVTNIIAYRIDPRREATAGQPQGAASALADQVDRLFIRDLDHA